MNQKIEIHRYELFSSNALNVKSGRRGHVGALIRLDGGRWAGCVHPWPELGDDPLDVQLEKLRAGESTPLIEQALVCAAADWRGLFPVGAAIPKSHFTCVDSENVDPAAVLARGFSTVKLKGDGRRLAGLKSEILRWAEAGFRIRVDFNETGVVREMVDFWEKLPNRGEIDFFEDPVPWDRSEWGILKSAGIPLAVDRGLEIVEKAAIADWWIVKPALVDAGYFGKKAVELEKRLVVTSYMDHAIGQLWAAHWAVRLNVEADCGLLTHELFAGDLFFDEMETSDAYLIGGAKTVGAFVKRLELLEWEML